MKSQSRTNGGTPRKVLRRWLQQLLGGDDVPTTETRLLLEPLEARQMMAGDVDLTPVNLPTSSLLSDSAEISSTSAQGEPQGEPAQDLVAFAKALKDAGVRFFGAIWCPFCNEQKALFGDGAPYLPFVEVTNPDRSLNSVGQQENIQTFPTWEFQNGTRVTGVKTLQELSTATGIAIPSSNNPSFRPIGNQTVLIGSPLYIPIDAYNPDNTPVTISVTSSNPSLLAATVLNNNRSLRFKIQDRGDMVFEMFESLAPTATARLIQLAQSGFYNKTASNTITFHRVIDNFVIQAGDPTGTGSGGSSLGTVRDDFNLDLQHNRSGLLSFAKSSDDTNDSQFFVTEGAQRHLDFNHSIMGVLVEGESVREGISQVPVNNTTVNKPTSDVIITSAEVFNDTENGVIQLKAVGNQTGTATITVTVTNQDGKTATEVFTVTIANDTTNTQPFLQPVVAPTTVPNGQSFNIQLASRDVEGDAVTYFARKLGNVNYTTSVNQSTGVVTVTPPAGFSGQLSVLVGVNQPSGLTFTTGSPEDTETVTVTVAAGAPTAVDLLAATDTGSSNTDNITSATSMQFTVSGVTAGSTVKLKAGATSLGEAVVASGQTSVTITTTKVADLGNGTHSITATQTIGGVESAASPALSVTFDTSAPGQITGDVLLSAIVGQPYVSDLAHPDEATGLNYSLQTSPAGMTIDATTGVISWTPTAGQVGTQPVIVKYTDLAGNTATQTFNVVVAASTSAIVRTEITDLSGNPLTTIASGQDFLVKIFVTDTRGVTAQGLFSAYLDVLYNAGLAEPSTTSPITYGSGFGNVQRPTLTDVNNARTNKTGKIGSFGGTNSSTAPVGADEQFLGTLRMKALKAGTLTVTTNPSEADGSEFLAYGTDTPVDEAKIQFGSDTLTITGSFTATNDTFNLDEDSTNFAMNVLANDQPASGSTLTIKSIGTAPTKGTATISADKKSIAFTPNANYNGGDQFTYVVQDQNGAEQTATVTVQVQPVNDAPTAVNDGLTVAQNASSTVIDVLANDLITPDSGETLRVTAVGTTSAGGTVTIQASGNNLVYTPKAGFIGTETFTYTISDRTSGGLTSTATVTVNVGTNAPTAVNDSFTVAEDAAAADFNLVANDSTSDPGETISVSAIATPSAGGTATLLSNGTGINYKPKANFSGTETIVYTLRDSSGATAQATVTFTVTGVNDAPTAVADAITVSKGSTATTISVLSNDTDPDTNDTLRVSAVGTASSGGTVTISSDGKSVLYTPPSATFTGTDTFTYTLSDAANSTSTATVTVTVADYVPRSIAIDVNGVNSSGNFRFMSGLTFTGTNSLGQAVNLTATPDSTGLATFTNLAPGTYTASLGTLPFLIGGSSTMTITSSATDGNSTNNSLNTGNLNPKYISLRDFSTATPEQSVLVALKAGQTATWMFLANDLGGLTNPTITLSSDVKTLTLRGTKNGQTQQATLNIGTDAAQLRGQEGDFYLLRVSTNTGVTFTPVPAGSGEPGSANSSTANSSTVAFNPATAASASSNRSTAAGEPDIDAALGLNSSLVISGSGDGVYATESLLSDSNESVGTTSPSTSGNQVLPFTSSNDDNEDEDDQDLTDAVDSIFSQLA